MKASAFPTILFLFPHPVQSTLAEVDAGSAPTERLYGLAELRAQGYTVTTCDSRFQGPLGGLRLRLRRLGIFLLDWKTLREIARHDVIIVKDDFSLHATLAARLLGKRIVYLDAMFNLPRRSWRRAIARLNLRGADAVVAYSQKQIELWSTALGVARDRFTFVPYTVDTEFYAPVAATQREEPYLLSVGRDLGRDFATLVEAVRGTGLRLKLVTLPYLLPPGSTNEPFIEIRDRVSYPELFELYANAAIVVVPLNDSLLYPSGIRAVLEAALLEKPTIATYTPVLEEYMTHDEDIVYVPPKDVAQLRAAILALMQDPTRRQKLRNQAKSRTLREYGMPILTQHLIAAIHGQ
jgi:glycosyltransferase involved in cell wall biosynthesis